MALLNSEATDVAEKSENEEDEDSLISQDEINALFN